MRIFQLILIFILSACSNISPYHSKLLPSEKHSAVTILLNKTNILIEKKDFKSAFAVLSLAEEIDSDNSVVLDGLGILAYFINDKELALRYFQNAIKKDRQNEVAYSHLGLIAKEKGDLKGAVELQRIALKINPTYVPARVRLSQLLTSK